MPEQTQETTTPAEETTEAAVTPQEEASPSPEGNDFKDISELLNMGETSPPSTEETPPEPTPQEAVPEGGKEEQKVAPASEPGDDGKPKADGELKALLKEVVAEAAESKAPPAPPSEDTKPAPQPKYAPQLPDAIFNALESAESQDRRDGMNALVGAMMNQVYTDLQSEMTTMSKRIMTTDVPEYLQNQSQQAEATKKMQDDFYGKYPTLGQTAEQRKLVAFVAMETAKQKAASNAYKGYTSEFRDEVAKAVSQMTGISLTAPVVGKQVPPGKKPGQVPIAAGSPTRAANAGKQTLGQEIASTILLN